MEGTHYFELYDLDENTRVRFTLHHLTEHVDDSARILLLSAKAEESGRRIAADYSGLLPREAFGLAFAERLLAKAIDFCDFENLNANWEEPRR